MKQIYFISIFLFSQLIQAQVYMPDKIIYNNQEFNYRFHHLEQYFNYYPEKRIIPTKDSTIIHRGYIATYEIFENELFLREIETTNKKNNQKVSVRDKFSPSKEQRIPLRWVNGVIQIGLGTDDFKKDSIHPMNDSNLIIEINRGKIKRHLYLGKEEMRIFKNFQWNKYKNTHEYLVIYHKLRNKGWNESEINQHIFENILYYSKQIFLQK